MQFTRPGWRQSPTRSPDQAAIQRPTGTPYRLDSNYALNRRFVNVDVHVTITDKSPAAVTAGDNFNLALGERIVVARSGPDTMHVIVQAAFQTQRAFLFFNSERIRAGQEIVFGIDPGLHQLRLLTHGGTILLFDDDFLFHDRSPFSDMS